MKGWRSSIQSYRATIVILDSSNRPRRYSAALKFFRLLSTQPIALMFTSKKEHSAHDHRMWKTELNVHSTVLSGQSCRKSFENLASKARSALGE